MFKFWLWLIVPIGLFLDLWDLKPLGWSGLEILLLAAIIAAITVNLRKNRKIKL